MLPRSRVRTALAKSRVRSAADRRSMTSGIAAVPFPELLMAPLGLPNNESTDRVIRYGQLTLSRISSTRPDLKMPNEPFVSNFNQRG